MFDEGKRLILPLVGGTMKKYRLGPAALLDEVINGLFCLRNCIPSVSKIISAVEFF